jgi:hypothetical protein
MSTREPYEYTSGNPLNMVDPTGLCGPFGDGGCPGGSLVPDEVRDALGTAGSKLKGAGETVVRCVTDAITCGENVKIAMAPLLPLGMTAVMGWGLIASCSTIIGCVVGAPIFLTGMWAGARGTWEAMQAVWFGEGHDQAYHPLGGHHHHHKKPEDCGSGSW